MHSPSSWGVSSQLRGVLARQECGWSPTDRGNTPVVFAGEGEAGADDGGQGRWQLQHWYVSGLQARLRSQVPRVQSCHFPIP